MTKLIILDGPDNVGKTTLANRLLTAPENERKAVLKVHSSKPKEGQDPYSRYFEELNQQLKAQPDLIVWDRGPLSAFIYEGYYRKSTRPFICTILDIQKLFHQVDLEYTLLMRDWSKVRSEHVREIIVGADDPNNATLEDREHIHALWGALADHLEDREQSIVKIKRQEW